MSNFDYLIGTPLKADYNILDKVISYHLPESHEISYPVNIQSYRYNPYGRSLWENININSADEYKVVMKKYQEYGYIITSIGTINVKNIGEYINCMRELIDNIISRLAELPDATVKLLQREVPGFELDYYDDLGDVEKLDKCLREQLHELNSRLPKMSRAVFPENK